MPFTWHASTNSIWDNFLEQDAANWDYDIHILRYFCTFLSFHANSDEQVNTQWSYQFHLTLYNL
jgi:hypothetical protein